MPACMPSPSEHVGFNLKRLFDELPRAVDDLCANLDSQLSPGGKGDILELDVRRLLPRPHATDLDAFLLVDD